MSPLTPPLPPGSKILVGMSGGVDSSVAAALLVEAGYEVTGGFIKNWSDSKDLWTGECQWRGERRDALRVAARLGISLLTFDFEEKYRERVLEKMFSEYEAGRTPNPDILCNEAIKFGLFFEEARRLGFDGVATGHYARSSKDADGIHLWKGVDSNKDQTYFLQRMSSEALSRALFPIGHLEKPAVRELAAKFALPTASKPDSQGICFVGKIDFHEFLRKKLPPKPGPILSADGEVLGQHDGLDAYTIGQRHGLHVNKDQRAWYVAGKDRAKNALIMVPDAKDPLLLKTRFEVGEMHWFSGRYDRTEGIRAEVMVRYRQTPVSATVRWLEGARYEVACDQPVWAPAPGQSVAVYQGEECLGGGVLLEDKVA